MSWDLLIAVLAIAGVVSIVALAAFDDVLRGGSRSWQRRRHRPRPDRRGDWYRWHDDEDGAFAVLAVIVIVAVLIPLAVLVIDLGGLWVTAARLQAASDFACLAAIGDDGDQATGEAYADLNYPQADGVAVSIDAAGTASVSMFVHVPMLWRRGGITVERSASCEVGPEGPRLTS